MTTPLLRRQYTVNTSLSRAVPKSAHFIVALICPQRERAHLMHSVATMHKPSLHTQEDATQQARKAHQPRPAQARAQYIAREARARSPRLHHPRPTCLLSRFSPLSPPQKSPSLPGWVGGGRWWTFFLGSTLHQPCAEGNVGGSAKRCARPCTRHRNAETGLRARSVAKRRKPRILCSQVAAADAERTPRGRAQCARASVRA